MSNYIPFDIQTEAGKRLWHKMNQHHGSIVLGPVGEGIVEVEEEMRDAGATRDYYAGMTEGRIQERERIIKLLDDYTMYRFEKQWMIDLIGGETNE